VVQAAVALADSRGLASVTMRKVARKLGVEAMSLYHHVTDREDLLDGMVDSVMGEIELPSGDDWRTAMRERAVSARRVLLAHRWAIGVLDSRSAPGPLTLGHREAVLASLKKGGFSTAKTAHAFAVLDSFIYGFVLQEVSLPIIKSEELAAVAEMVLRELPVERFPHLNEMTREYSLRPGYEFADEYELGLDLILDALDRNRGKSTA
jgi:AcrR family transcriptional regulator